MAPRKEAAALHPRSASVASFVQALVFAYSASVQLNDYAIPNFTVLSVARALFLTLDPYHNLEYPAIKNYKVAYNYNQQIGRTKEFLLGSDWYFWLPLYSLASVVCLTNMTRFTTTSRRLAYVGFVSGSVMFFKVFLEGCLEDNFRWKDIISLDMNQRLVREKFGSLLVCLSMWVCTGDSENSRKKAGKTGSKSRSGMRLIAVISTCLCIAYFSGRE